MKPFTTLTGVAAPLDRVDVDTDQVIPAEYLKSIERIGFGKYLFARWRYIGMDLNRPDPDFVLNQPRFRAAQVLVTRENFGCGSSREHAAWALEDYGIRCVIAPSFGDIFYSNALKNGVLPAIVANDDVSALLKQIQDCPDLQVRVDLKEQVIGTNHGLSCRFTVGADAKYRLLNGLDDIGLTLLHEKEIAAFEERRKRNMPWL
ncbi:MAG: 3-isopropylmalate dehydratase small subunit [SAR324 cluster bacterium]